MSYKDALDRGYFELRDFREGDLVLCEEEGLVFRVVDYIVGDYVVLERVGGGLVGRRVIYSGGRCGFIPVGRAGGRFRQVVECHGGSVS